MQTNYQRLLVDDLATEIITETVTNSKSSISIGPLLIPIPPSDVLPNQYRAWMSERNIMVSEPQDTGGGGSGGGGGDGGSEKWRRASAGAVGMLDHKARHENGNGMKSNEVKKYNTERFVLIK